METLSKKLTLLQEGSNVSTVLSTLIAEAEELENIAYIVNCLFVSEGDRNFGDAENWKHKLKLATERYFDRVLE